MSTVDVTWAQKVNTTAVGSQLTKTGGSDATADAGAVSQSITTLPCELSFLVSQTDKTMRVGISDDPSNATTIATIDYNFAIWAGGTAAEARQGSTFLEDFGAYTTGTVFKMVVETDGTVKWYMGGVLKRTSAPGAMPAVPLVADVTIEGSGGIITSATITTDAVVASGAYEALLASHAPAFVVLVEPQPMEPLHTWTAAGGGLTNTWYASFLTQIATDVVAGGLFRRLDFVRQNDTDLNVQTTAALVNSNLGSYWHDTATSRIYVSTTTGTTPDVWALVGAWFTLFFSTTSVFFTDQPLFLPLVTGALPSLSSEKPDLVFGAIVADQGEVSLLNGDGLFDRLSRRYVWRNKKVTFKLGGTSLAYSDFATVAVMRINTLGVDDEVAILQLESLGSVLNQSLPGRTWREAGYGLLVVDGAADTPRPLLFGSVDDCPLTKMILGDGYYTVQLPSGAPGATVRAAYAVDRVSLNTTVLVEDVDYIVISELYIIGDFPPETYQIRADLTSTEDSGTCGSIATRLLTLCGVADADIDTASFAAADLLQPATLGLWLDVETPAVDIMRWVEQSVMGTVAIGTDGHWTMRLFNPSLPADWTLAETDFAVWQPVDELTGVLNEVRVQYHKNFVYDTVKEHSASDDTVRYSNETSDSHGVLTLLRDDTPAVELAQHLRFLKSATPALISFEERGLTLMAAEVGDLAAVTRGRAPQARTGRYDGHLLEIVQLDKQLGPDYPTVRGVLNDLGGRTDEMARCEDAAVDLNWSAATAAQRAVYGFCADANGYVDAADTLTKDGKVVW